MDAIKFGSFVASVRKEKNMTQAELATKIQVTDKAVSRWERKLIAIAIGSVALLSVFILLVDHIGWSLQNIIFTSVGVVLPIVCGLAIFALAVLAIIRKCMGKSCRQIAIASLIFVAILVVMVILFFMLGMMAFPGQK